jgi:hypothetical protein
LFFHGVSNVTVIKIHQAKTVKPGEIQLIKLRPMNSPLCPVKAVEKRLRTTLMGTDSLFGHDQDTTRVNITKQCANNVLSAAWQHLGKPELLGHSFQVGGASLQSAVGINVEQIKNLGSWTSESYQRYIKTLSPNDIVNSLAVLELQSL